MQRCVRPSSTIGRNLTVSVLWVSALVVCGNAQSSPSTATSATTTLQALTANNTSASNSFTAQLNGLPKPANVSKVDTHSLLYRGSNTRIFAHLLGWFADGEGNHMNVGYRSDDPQQVHRQVVDMISRGIQGTVFDWFGQTNHPGISATAIALRNEAEQHPGFEFAIMEDGGALVTAAKANGCDVTTQLLSDLQYINTTFVTSPAYARFNGQPVIFFFGVDSFYIDWAKVRAEVANNPLFLFEGTDGLTRPISNGGFQWVAVNGADAFHPASPNPFDQGLEFQAAFYSTPTNGRLAVGSVYRGFNDSLAPWGVDRFSHPSCGQTWLATFGEIGRFYSSSHQLPALQIVTWNDYDEGTAVEMGIDNCISVQPGISGNTLNWSVNNGSEATVDHYTIYSSVNGQNLTKLADVPVGTHSLNLAPFHLTSRTLYVYATGRPGIQNKVSPAINFRAGDHPPVARIAAAQTAPLTFLVSLAGSRDPDGSIAHSTIDFGDGTVVAGPNARHTYAAVGSYNIAGTVFDRFGASAVVIQRVSAKAVSGGVTIFSPPPGGVVNFPSPAFVASANSRNPIALMRVLVDGTQIYAINQDTVNTALKIYQGKRQITVQAIDTRGAVFTRAVNINAEPNNIGPTASLESKPLPEVASTAVLFCGENWHDPDGFVNAFQWTFTNPAQQQFIPGPVHTFSAPGTYTVKQFVIDEFGAPDTITQQVTVNGSLATPTVSLHQQDEKTQKQQSIPIRGQQPQ